MGNIIYDIRWSDNVDDKFIDDFCFVCSTVFNSHFTKDDFNRKYSRNIYGHSIIVVVYINDSPSAARALWRNDIEGREAYQPGDTCVMENCRGKGIFSTMTKKAVALLPANTIIYNFPNSNSFPGYIKMGWKLVHDYRMRLLCSYDSYYNEHSVMMDNEYAKWWISGRNLFYTKFQGHYFIIRKDRRLLCYRIIAEVNKEIALQFPHIKYGLFFYKSTHKAWYSKYFAVSHVVCLNNDIDYIPIWKIDAI